MIEESSKSIYTFVRADKSPFLCGSFLRTIKTITRDDLDDIIKVGMRKYDQAQTEPFILIKLDIEQINIMMDGVRSLE